MPSANFAPFRFQQTLEHPAARERMLEVQLVNPAHQHEVGVRGRSARKYTLPRLIPSAFAWPVSGSSWDLSIVLRSPAVRLCRARPPKKSLASVNALIFACRTLTSTAGAASAFELSPKTAV